MLRLDKVIKPWKESAALNDHINLYGFWTETACAVDAASMFVATAFAFSTF